MAINVHSRSLRRAHWHAELTAALREAERLLQLLANDGSCPAETNQLCQRIAAVRSEVEGLNRMASLEDRIVGEPWSEPDPPQGGDGLDSGG